MFSHVDGAQRDPRVLGRHKSALRVHGTWERNKIFFIEGREE